MHVWNSRIQPNTTRPDPTELMGERSAIPSRSSSLPAAFCQLLNDIAIAYSIAHGFRLVQRKPTSDTSVEVKVSLDFLLK